ncbi:hypothetical protein PGB90_010183 [Kerria lacca]
MLEEEEQAESESKYGVIVQASVSRLVKRLHLFLKIFLGLVVITPAVTPGMSTSFSAIALPQLNLNLNEASWFGKENIRTSVASIATPIGNLFIGCIIDKFGRRVSLIISIIPSILGWAVLSVSQQNLTLLYIGRLLTGFALGSISLPSTVYAAECIAINNNYWRSSLSTWTTIALSTGILLCYTFGALAKYNEVALIAFILSVLSLLMILSFIPESPAWLFRKGRIGDAEMAQKKLRISQPILLNLRYQQKCNICKENREPEIFFQHFVKFIAQIKRQEVYKPLLITTFVSGLLQVIGLTCLTFLIPIYGIKILSIISLLGMSLGYLCLGAILAIKDYSWQIFLSYIHIFSVWFIVFMASIGMLAIPFSILGEIFPMGAKGYARLQVVQPILTITWTSSPLPKYYKTFLWIKGNSN